MINFLESLGCAVLVITLFLSVSCGFKETADLYRLLFLRLWEIRFRRCLLMAGLCVIVIYGVVSLRGRYSVTRVANGVAYQVDNLTGKTWLLVGDRKMPVEPTKPATVKAKHWQDAPAVEELAPVPGSPADKAKSTLPPFVPTENQIYSDVPAGATIESIPAGAPIPKGYEIEKESLTLTNKTLKLKKTLNN